MRRWIHQLASLKITVALLILILAALSVGTIVESRHGAEAARAVYYALWFHAILAAFVLNLLFAIIERWPFGRHRIGFLLTHSSMILILAGALWSHVGGTNGRMALWEGEESSEFMTFPTPDVHVPHQLPFKVRLDAFEIDVYPGTQRPAMFRSRVSVTDPGAAAPVGVVIEMNREMSHAGWKLFQSSYQIEEGREMTVLQVSRDPGMPLVFVGYTLLVLGMITVLGTRIGQRRAMAALMVIALACSANAAPVPDAATVASLRSLPVQHDGRVMPLDTVAREALRDVTGKSGWDGADPVAVVLGWSFSPDEWGAVPMIRVGGRGLGAAAGFPPGAKRLSYQDLLHNRQFLTFLRQTREKQAADQRLTKAEQHALEIQDRILTVQSFFLRRAWHIVPSADPVAVWAAPESLRTLDHLKTAAAEMRAGAPAYYPTAAAMAREITYNRVDPSRLAWWILVPATIFSVLAWQKPRRGLVLVSALGLMAGFAVMTWGIATRWQVAGRIPASNMYESMLFLGWGVGLFALIVSGILRNRLVIMNATAMSALAMLLANLLPIDPFIHPIPPVLAGTPWLAIHVPIIMVSYSVLTLGVLVAHLQIGLTIRGKGNSPQGLQMIDLLYWYIQIGSILLIIGILTGSIWAASSWGRYWGWDPKEVWSLVAFLAYMAILHGRFDRIIGPFGVAVASVAAFWAILMTYIGVNFVLASGLHSYGFGSSSVVRWMGAVAAVEILFLLAGWRANRKSLAAAGRSRRHP